MKDIEKRWQNFAALNFSQNIFFDFLENEIHKSFSYLFGLAFIFSAIEVLFSLEYRSHKIVEAKNFGKIQSCQTVRTVSFYLFRGLKLI